MRNPPRKLRRAKVSSDGFSLVEVVMALGILAFAITALLGAFAVGMHTDRESVEELQATHLMQTILAERRAAPTLEDPNLVLPPLDAPSSRSTSDPASLNETGRALPGSRTGKFGLVYRVTPDSATNSAAVYCAIYWPGQAEPAKAQGRVEMVTTIALP